MVPAALAALAAAGAGSIAGTSLDDALDQIAASGMLLTDGLVFLVPRARGLAALAAGRLDDARAHLSEAIGVAGAIGADAEGARARLDLARALSTAGEVAAATEQARGVADRATTLGMAPLATAANVLLDELGDVAVPPRSAPATATAVILFTDLVGSTDLTERVGDAAYRAIADRLDAELRTLVETCGGEAIPGIRLGDGLVALFASARGALEFAAGAHRSALALDLSLRVGVHAGDMIRAGDVVSGGAVNVAARVCDSAEPGETLVSETVRALARTSAEVFFHDRGEHRLKGVTDPHHLYAVRSGDR
jgi:class 3 adenylate cyclase